MCQAVQLRSIQAATFCLSEMFTMISNHPLQGWVNQSRTDGSRTCNIVFPITPIVPFTSHPFASRSQFQLPTFLFHLSQGYACRLPTGNTPSDTTTHAPSIQWNRQKTLTWTSPPGSSPPRNLTNHHGSDYK